MSSCTSSPAARLTGIATERFRCRHRAHGVSPRATRREAPVASVDPHSDSPRSEIGLHSHCAGSSRSTDAPGDLFAPSVSGSRLRRRSGGGPGGNGLEGSGCALACLSRQVWLGGRLYDAHHGGVTRLPRSEERPTPDTMVAYSQRTASSPRKTTAQDASSPRALTRSSTVNASGESRGGRRITSSGPALPLRDDAGGDQLLGACAPCASAQDVAYVS